MSDPANCLLRSLSLPPALADLEPRADPVLLAGMANISLPELAAAVSNAGGMGIVGGAFITPDTLRKYLRELKSLLVHTTLVLLIMMEFSAGEWIHMVNLQFPCLITQLKFLVENGTHALWTTLALYVGGDPKMLLQM